MNVYAKQKQRHRLRYRKQACGYQREREWRRSKITSMGLRDTNYYV